METPKLIIDRDIAVEDKFFEAVFGVKEDVFSSKQVSQFLDENKTAKEIEVEITCDGGSTSEAKITFDLLRNSGKRITTKGYKVNSSAVVAFLAGDERLISENADFVIHPVWIQSDSLPFKLDANDLIEYGTMMRDEENRLVNIYCSVIGEDKRDEVVALMAAETNLSADEVIRLGFATGKLEAKNVKSENKRAVSFSNKMAELIMNKSNQNQNQKEMSLLTETLNKINDTLSKFKNSDEPENKETLNASVELSEGGSVYFDGELAEGVAVFIDETMETKAPAGDHLLADGRVITVDGEGMVTAIAAASAEDAPTPEDKTGEGTENKEVEELKNTVSTLTETVNAQSESINKIAETLKNMTPAFTALQNLVPGDTGGESTPKNKRTKAKEVTAAEYAKMTNLEKKRYNQSRL